MANDKNNTPDPSVNDADATNASIDWEAFDMPEVVELADKDRPIVAVPAPLVALAQKSRDSKKRLQISFRDNLTGATEFARLMRSAGDHTVPPSSMTVVQDGILVRFRAGERRGRKVNGK